MPSPNPLPRCTTKRPKPGHRAAAQALAQQVDITKHLLKYTHRQRIAEHHDHHSVLSYYISGVRFVLTTYHPLNVCVCVAHAFTRAYVQHIVQGAIVQYHACMFVTCMYLSLAFVHMFIMPSPRYLPHTTKQFQALAAPRELHKMNCRARTRWLITKLRPLPSTTTKLQPWAAAIQNWSCSQTYIDTSKCHMQVAVGVPNALA